MNVLAPASTSVPAPLTARPPVVWSRAWPTVNVLAASATAKPTVFVAANEVVRPAASEVSDVPAIPSVPPSKTSGAAVPPMFASDVIESVPPVSVVVPL